MFIDLVLFIIFYSWPTLLIELTEKINTGHGTFNYICCTHAILGLSSIKIFFPVKFAFLIDISLCLSLVLVLEYFVKKISESLNVSDRGLRARFAGGLWCGHWGIARKKIPPSLFFLSSLFFFLLYPLFYLRGFFFKIS